MKKIVFHKTQFHLNQGNLFFCCFISLIILPVLSFAQNQVSGTVKDNSGNPLPNVSVVIKNSQKGTTSDARGNFSISVNRGQVIVFSFTGFETKEVKISDQTALSVTLSPKANSLNEVVVIGYGTKKKKDLTGSISSVSADELQKVPATSFTSAIEGKVPGVMISQTTGAPGGASTVRIRGITTTGGNQPLYVVDGVPMSNANLGVPGSGYNIDPLSVINPNDIESVEVLKDAASSAIYGTRGANGVILVTTKRGKEGAAVVSLDASVGFAQLWKKPAFLNAEQFAKMANELYINSGLTPNPEWAHPEALGKGTDMVGLIFRNAPRQNYNVSVDGGTRNLKARLSLGYTNQEGTIIETNYERYTGRANIDLKAGAHFHFGGSLAFSVTNSKGLNTDAMQGGIFNLAQQFFPTLSPDSAFYGDPVYYTKDGDNPILRAKSMDNRLNNSRIYGNVYGEYEIIPALKFKTSVGIDANFNRTSMWQGKIHRGFYNHPQATLNENFNNRFFWLIESTLSYSKNFGYHSLSVVAGQTSQQNKDNWLSSVGTDYLNENLQVINGSDVSLRTTTGSASNATLASYFGRIDYSFKDRYLLSMSLRRDGSSNFGENNKWGYFPAVSAGWRLSQESFMKSTEKIISDLKIRGSWGRVGNDAIPAFGYASTIRSGTDNYVLGTGDQSIVLGSTLLKPGNPDLKWESTEQLDIGLDATLLNDKIYLTADYFKKNTNGMLISLPVSLEAGFQNVPTVNGGQVQNKGFELLLGYRNDFKNGRFDISGNISTLKNKVLSLGVGQPIAGSTLGGYPVTYTVMGQPIGYFRGFIIDGIYQTNEEVNKKLQPTAIAGDFKYRDINGDSALTDADQVFLGKPWPDLTYGFNASVSFKGFDLNVLVQGIAGVQIFHRNKISNYEMKYFNGNGIINGVKDILNHWTPGSGVNNIPGLKFTDANGNYSKPSTFFIENGAYTRVRNVVLGYTIPSTALQSTVGNRIRSFRVYFAAQNLLTFTHYSGFDPEVGDTSPTSSGIDTGNYPQPRTFTAGVNITF
jgi:TonB-linked SusC/RagA family outer membrane protein